MLVEYEVNSGMAVSILYLEEDMPELRITSSDCKVGADY